MARVNPQEAADKLIRRLSGATEDIRRGIQQVTTAPSQAAIAQKELLKQKINEAIDNGTWEAGLNAVSLQDWKDAALNKGVSRIAGGISAARPKLTKFYSELLPAVDAAAAEVRAMPKGTLEDSINRMVTYTRAMSNFRKTR